MATNPARPPQPKITVTNMLKQRSSGILAHLTSLPSPYGIGDLGPSAYKFIDFLAKCDQSYWQFLPTGPTNAHFDHSPYMSTSAFAGSPLLISPELLFKAGLIAQETLLNIPDFSPYFTEFEKVELYKKSTLKEAFSNFQPQKSLPFQNFTDTTPWLDDYTLFMALKTIYEQSGWFSWPVELARKSPAALEKFRNVHEELLNYYRFEQFIFFEQWNLLHEYATDSGVKLFGDLPIYVSYDSVDVWANQQLFLLDRETLKPEMVSGVPPDYFSETGQRWGNPLYDWGNKKADIQDQLTLWWTNRLSHLFSMVDLVRIDHFRGFESYWAIPEDEETAINGEWQKGPGKQLFSQIEKKLGKLKIVAEDLGIITEEVEQLRDELGFPGMKILQFAFDENPDNSYLPFNFQSPHCLIYTGTHDNDTTVGWYLSDELNDNQRQLIRAVCNRHIHDQQPIHHDLMYLAQSSISNLCIFPLQDVLGFGSDCRMNRPGTSTGNWKWRCAQEYLTNTLADELKISTRRFGRGQRKNMNKTPSK